MSQSKVDGPKSAAVGSAAAQQSDNIAHALAGAGGGILSMILTCALHPQEAPLLGSLVVRMMLIRINLQVSSDHAFNPCASRV